ncbi:ATP-binding protein [Loktanella sp. S4079]|uniref:ATP-binding protein n=1 Tax=Loktanella sp. S4079 TaxID=579483 RepID=UPI000697535A|nr:ATP-binding protein [Loktanella sp. S4079]
MVLYVLENVALLILAGVGIFFILSGDPTGKPRLGRHFLIGLVMGLIVLIVSSDAYVTETMHAPLDSRMGPLVYAGFLGGPVAAGVAAFIGSLAEISADGTLLSLGFVYGLATALVGCIVARIIKHDPRENVPHITVCYLMLGALLVQFTTLMFVNQRGVIDDPPGLFSILFMSLANVMTIPVMHIIVEFAKSVAASSVAARENARRLQLATDVSQIGILERTAGSEIATYDAGFARIQGLSAGGGTISIGRARSLIHPSDQPEVVRAIRNVWAGNPPTAPIVFRLMRPNGEIRHVQVSWAIEPQGAAKVERARAIYLDVTDVNHLLRQKEDAENRLSQIIENLPVAFLSFEISADKKVSFKYISPNCGTIWGYTEADLSQNPELFEQMVEPKDLPKLLRAISFTAETLEPLRERITIKTKSNEIKHLDARANVTSMVDGRVQIDSFILDVTAEFETQQKLEKQIAVSQQAQKNEAIGQLTGGVAHDFNNLLAIIIGNIELLLDGLSDPEQRELANAAMTAGEKGADLTRSLLAFARKSALVPSVVDLNKTVLEIQKWTTRTIPPNIEIETTLLEDLWHVTADPGATESALLNLILNARDAISERGKITIETSNIVIHSGELAAFSAELVPGRYALLTVRDDGEGISSETIKEIFEPFFTTKAVGAGSGLGLSMVQGFMQQSGGAVEISSKLGVGTTVRLYFRASDSEVSAETETPAPALNAENQEHILIAEDEIDLLSVVSNTLQMAGYRVTAAHSGDEALSLFQADPSFDLLLTDVVMPGKLRGTELADQVRRINPDLPVVFMSGFAGDATDLHDRARPSDIKLMKPVQRRELLSALAKALGR